MARQALNRTAHATTAYALPDEIRMSDGTRHPVPEGRYFEWRLLGLVGRMAQWYRTEGECTLLVDALVHEELCLPVKPPEDGAEDHGRIVADSAVRGWSTSKPRAWMTFRRENAAVVHVLFEAWSDADSGVLYHRDPQTHTARYDWWRSHFGVAYTGTPGYAGAQTMRATLERRRGGAGITFQPRNAFEVPEWSGSELPYLRKQWSRPSTPGSWEHGYDANLAYLAAANVSLLAPHPLQHTGKLDFDPGLAGWWLCSVGKLQVPELEQYLPDPAGYGRVIDSGKHKGRRWLSTPTVKLISDLRDGGVHGGITVHDSWTAVGVTLLKPWTTVISEALTGFLALPEDERRVRRMAVKKSVTHGIGMLRRPGGITRPDWHAIVVANSRTNLWRKLHHVFEVHGRGPLRINNDCVWYASDIADAGQAFPAVTDRPLFQLADRPDQLGRFKIEDSTYIEIGERVTG